MIVLLEGIVTALEVSEVLLREASFRVVQTLSDGMVAEVVEFMVVELDKLAKVEEFNGRPFNRPPKEAFNSHASAGVRSPFNAGNGRPKMENTSN